MPYPQFSRSRLAIRPLKERKNQVQIEQSHVPVNAKPRVMSGETAGIVKETVIRIAAARKAGKSVMLTFGAHTIKNGLGLVLRRLIEDGWVTHLATNGAGVIHDWEIAYQGATSEYVRENIAAGQFGIWQETGYYINLAIAVGAYEGLGYGESVGVMIQKGGLQIPDAADLESVVRDSIGFDADRSAAAADLLGLVKQFSIKPGFLPVSHPFKKYSIQAAACRLKVPFTGHPMIGHDIIYEHPANNGGAIGRAGLRDFLTFADSVSRLDGGVYMSVGSAVMSPMIFEKSFSMCRNIKLQKRKGRDDHYIAVVDLIPATGGWADGKEPAPSDAAYYQRYLKTFSRMGGTMRYVCADNRDFLLAVSGELRKQV